MRKEIQDQKSAFTQQLAQLALRKINLTYNIADNDNVIERLGGAIAANDEMRQKFDAQEAVQEAQRQEAQTSTVEINEETPTS